MSGSVPHRTAVRDPALAARVVARRPLRYADGADAALDRPAHVRAGSSLARVPGGVAVVQDDANFLAVVDPARGLARAITLPAGAAGRRQFDDGRGNKRHKLDLEACVSVPHDGDTLLLAFGSGSSARRERVLLVDGWAAAAARVTVAPAPALYALLRRAEPFAGGELNVEGAAFLGDRVRLFGRGNGAAREGVAPASATCDLAWPALLDHLRAPDRHPPPHPTAVVRYDLGAIAGVRLGFTDAAPWREVLLYAAAAEDSPDAVRDGAVAGSALGVVDAAGATRWTPLVEADGRPFAGKVEGLLSPDDAGDAAGGDDGGGDRVLVVVDSDDPDAPSELCTVALHGAWRRAPAAP